MATRLTTTRIQIVDPSRPFMTASKKPVLSYSVLSSQPTKPKLARSNDRNRKSLRQAAQVEGQRQAVLVPQHAAAVRHFERRLVHHQRFGGGVGADDFIGGDAHAQVVALRVAAQTGDHNVPRRQVGATSFGEGDVHHRHDGAAQVEDAHQEGRAQRQARDRPPLHHLFHVQHPQAKALAPGAEDAVLALRQPLFGLRDARAFLLRRNRFELGFFRHGYKNFCTVPSNSSRVKGLTTYPSAPCCSAQNLSLCEFFEVTRTTGMLPNSAWLFSSRQAWNPLRPGMTTSSRIRLGRSMAMVCSMRLESWMATGQ